MGPILSLNGPSDKPGTIHTDHAEDKGLCATSLHPMLGVIRRGLGHYTLRELSDQPRLIERWLNATQDARRWSDTTWVRYYELLRSLFKRAITWRIGGRARLATNPLADIKPKKPSTMTFPDRLDEEAERRLLDACDLLDTRMRRSGARTLTPEKADEIRRRAHAGEQQAALATEFRVSPATVCQIANGQTWRRDRIRSTKGTEMRRRVIAAFDTGLRTSELLQVQLKHVNFRAQRIETDGVVREILEIRLPPDVSKGGKTTGKFEFVYAATDRLKNILTARRFQLRDDPESYVFGTEGGKRVKSFRRMWPELFRLAGLDPGRHSGQVWHRLRHEFCSRAAEATPDALLVQELARHKDLRTTLKYVHTRRDRILSAAARASGGR